ncbi:MAG: DMT family transporter, partial [Treponema sp.]|nr:DMT family transporter [Treponema sp.]
IGLFHRNEKITRKDLLVIAAGSLLGIAFTQGAFSIGISLITPVLWSLIVAMNPIGVLLLSALLLKESISIKKTIGVITGIAGAVLIISKNWSGSILSGNILGIGIAILSVISYSLYIVIMRKSSGKYDAVTIMKWMFLFSAIAISPFGLGELPKQRLYSNAIEIVPVLQLGFALIFSSILAFFLMPIALKRIKATTASIYINLQPIVASVVAIIVSQDVFSWDKPLALILVIVGVFIVTQEPNEKTIKP